MSEQTPINVFVPVFRVEECLKEIRDCLEKGWSGLGYKTVEFEEAWKRYTGLDNALFVNSGTAALHLAVAILKSEYGWKDGDEIVTTPFTFVSTNQAILYERLKPVFADVDQYFCLDPASVEERITPRTRAVMFVGYGGSPGQLGQIQGICARKHLALIIDGAHMSGTRIHGLHAGRGAQAATFSFHAVKNLPTGDSGMVCFQDKKLDAEARKISWMGINKDTYNRMSDAGAYKWRYDVEREGWKYNGNSIQAALGLVGLRYLDQDNAYRRQLARWYDALFIPQDPIGLMHPPPDCEPSGHIYPILVDARDDLMMFLNSANIFPGVHYRINTEYPMFRHGLGTCPNAEQVSRRVMSLPLHLKLTRSDVERVVWWIREFFRKRS